MIYITEVEQLRITRLIRRNTQKQIAARLGKTQEWLSQVERGIIQTDSFTLSRLKEILRPESILKEIGYE